MYVTTIVTRALITTIILGFQISKNTFLMSSPTILPWQGLTPSPPILAVALPHAGKWQFGKSYEMPGPNSGSFPQIALTGPHKLRGSKGGFTVCFGIPDLRFGYERHHQMGVQQGCKDNATTCSLSNHHSSKQQALFSILEYYFCWLKLGKPLDRMYQARIEPSDTPLRLMFNISSQSSRIKTQKPL